MITETIRGMTHVSPFATVKFRNRTWQEIGNIYFPAAEKQFFNEIGIVTDIDTDSNPNTFLSSTSFYFDTNKNRIIGDKGDTFAFKMILHVSKNGNKIKEAYEVYKPNPGEILLFMEDNEGDFSDQILRIKVANDVRERLKDSILYSDNVVDYVNRNFPLDPALLKQLVEKGYVEEGFTFSRDIMGGLYYAMRVVSAPSKAMGWIVTRIGEGVELLTIPDSIWDTESEDYFLKKENVVKDLTINMSFLDELSQKLQDDKSKLQANDFIPDFITENLQKFLSKLKLFLEKYNVWVERTVSTLYERYEKGVEALNTFTDIPEGIAFYVGIWNGLIDFIASTLKFFGGILEAPFNLSKDRQEMLESIDSMFDMLAEINLSDVVEAFSAIYLKIKTFFKDSSGDGYNYVHIAYAVGFGIAFIGTFFIPFTQLVKFTNLHKISKIIPVNFFKDLSGLVSKSTTHLAGKTKNAYLNSLKVFEQLLAVFAKGKASVTAFLEKIWKKIAAWLVKNKKLFEGVALKAKELLKRDTKTDELFRNITKKLLINNKGNLSKRKFLKIAKQIEKHFGAKLHWIDRNNREFVELYKKWYDNPIFGVFHNGTFKNGRYGLVLPGPGIYFFQGVHKFGGTIKITAYTLQHELVHLKLWYKMTKEFPELTPLFKRIPSWLDEANVIGEILAQNARKPNKWDIGEIIKDLNTLNRNFAKNKAWRDSVKRILGKERLELKDFKNWDLSRILEKL